MELNNTLIHEIKIYGITQDGSQSVVSSCIRSELVEYQSSTGSNGDVLFPFRFKFMGH